MSRRAASLLHEDYIWSITQSLNFIAFGWADEYSREAVEWPDDCDPGLLSALDAIISGEPLYKPQPPENDKDAPDWTWNSIPPEYTRLEQRAENLVTKSGRDAKAIADEMRPIVEAILAEAENRSIAWEYALQKFSTAFHNGQISAFTGMIHSDVLRRAVSIDTHLRLVFANRHPGMFLASDVRRLSAVLTEERSSTKQDDLETRISATKASSRAPRGRDYREADEILVAQAIKGINNRQYRNLTDAGRALASQAEGGASEASRAARLSKRIKEALSSKSSD